MAASGLSGIVTSGLPGIALKKGTVLIGGGSGFIGTALSKLLGESGYNTIVVSRKPGPSRISWEEIEKTGLPEKCVAVVNLSGQNVLDPTRRWTPGFKQNVYASRVRTTELLAQAVARSDNPPKIFASISGVGYYKPCLTTEYDEGSPGGDHDFLSKLCKDWENASNMLDVSKTRRVIIRSGVVLGREGGMIAQLIWPFWFFVGGPVGSGEQFMPWIHVHDLVRLFKRVIQQEDCQGVYNGVAPEVITNKMFAVEFGHALSRPALLPLPVFALNWAFSPERAVMMTEGQYVIPKRTIESGFQFKYPKIESAMKECARIFVTKQETRLL